MNIRQITTNALNYVLKGNGLIPIIRNAFYAMQLFLIARIALLAWNVFNAQPITIY